MIANFQQITENELFRKVLDWTVFSIGVLSLTTAITATIVTHSANAQAEAGAETQVTTG